LRGRNNKVLTLLNSGKSARFIDERDSRWWDNTIYPVTVQGHAKKIDRFVVFSQDVTDLKRAQDELHLYRTQMAKAERLASAGTLSAMVAHELSQPLTVIRLSVQNALAELRETQDMGVVESDLDHCLESVEHVSRLIHRFRNYAHTVLERHRVEVHLGPILNQAIQLAHEAFKLANVEVRVHGMADLPALVACSTDLDQLFFIFLENAFHAADPQKAHTLDISGAAGEGTVEIRFQDDCRGVASDKETRLFEPFFTTKPHGAGTGLGLCVAERIVEEMGGRIEFDNHPGHGITFIVTFPMAGRS
jgi:C4-dicarboxylate-specific signal transduction histidine kinase